MKNVFQDLGSFEQTVLPMFDCGVNKYMKPTKDYLQHLRNHFLAEHLSGMGKAEKPSHMRMAERV